MKLRFHPEAVAEYQDAARYYAEREDGLDLRFILSIESAIRAASVAPLQFRIFENDIRRVLSKVFPYAVLYSVEQDYILIIAVMHCHREPGYWRKRISQ